ncbi:MAG: hypothetical protein OXI05_07195 [Bacteroidota bacterium]|nr:hypothetical protein [Bacteroidota bacterium]MXW14234.1 hypothetical protein [Rhodothermaceae bacterium]MYC04263.1 hypothetical protein [Rhodothermaceae bacterium]MYI17080.1 hypothetical protein [Rhodothermaceae bacterium]
MVNHNVKIAIQALMAVLIVVLGVWLYRSITEPWETIEREQALTELTRQQMIHIRTGLTHYEREEDRFPSSLDSLVLWLHSDSLTSADILNVFDSEMVLDSLIYSPRTGSAFEYALNDTGRVAIYLLQDPDSDDYIGSDIPDITLLNAASWE